MYSSYVILGLQSTYNNTFCHFNRLITFHQIYWISKICCKVCCRCDWYILWIVCLVCSMKHSQVFMFHFTHLQKIAHQIPQRKEWIHWLQYKPRFPHGLSYMPIYATYRGLFVDPFTTMRIWWGLKLAKYPYFCVGVLFYIYTYKAIWQIWMRQREGWVSLFSRFLRTMLMIASKNFPPCLLSLHSTTSGNVVSEGQGLCTRN